MPLGASTGEGVHGIRLTTLPPASTLTRSPASASNLVSGPDIDDVVPGDLAGRWRLERVLGDGGAATTYAATDLADGGLVALKILRFDRLEDWKGHDLFEREARALAQLDHPGIPRFVDFGNSADGKVVYLAQELIVGDTLRERTRRRPLGEAGAKEVAAALLQVLVALQGRSPPLYHRDVKPANVILAQDGVHLVDFGAVRGADLDPSRSKSTVVGTFGFMAPEQLWGEASNATDVFGVGMTAVFALSGVEPEELERDGLSVRLPEELPISAAFRRWLEQATSPEPAGRFASAVEALDALGTAPTPLSPDVASALVPASAVRLLGDVPPSPEVFGTDLVDAGRGSLRIRLPSTHPPAMVRVSMDGGTVAGSTVFAGLTACVGAAFSVPTVFTLGAIAAGLWKGVPWLRRQIAKKFQPQLLTVDGEGIEVESTATGDAIRVSWRTIRGAQVDVETTGNEKTHLKIRFETTNGVRRLETNGIEGDQAAALLGQIWPRIRAPHRRRDQGRGGTLLRFLAARFGIFPQTPHRTLKQLGGRLESDCVNVESGTERRWRIWVSADLPAPVQVFFDSRGARASTARTVETFLADETTGDAWAQLLELDGNPKIRVWGDRIRFSARPLERPDVSEAERLVAILATRAATFAPLAISSPDASEETEMALGDGVRATTPSGVEATADQMVEETAEG